MCLEKWCLGFTTEGNSVSKQEAIYFAIIPRYCCPSKVRTKTGALANGLPVLVKISCL